MAAAEAGATMTITFRPTCDLYDAHPDAARVPSVSWQNLGGVREFCGAAVTVKCFEDNSRIKELVAAPGEGRVMVVDGGGSHRCALVGDVLAGQAQRNGWAGIVVFGCVRDKAALGGLALGVMALGVIRANRCAAAKAGWTSRSGSRMPGAGRVMRCTATTTAWCFSTRPERRGR